MMSLVLWWQKTERRFAAYSLRERGLIAGALLAAVAMGGSTLLVEPEFARVSSLRQSLQTKEGEMAQLRVQAAGLQARAALDPDASVRQELTAAQQRLQAANESLLQANAAMVPAARMNEVLERILRKQKGLQVVSMRTLDPAPFIETKSVTIAGEVKPAPGFEIFRHGVEIKLAGSYADLHAYLRQLEAEKQKFLWGEMRIQVKEYPGAEMTLILHTLSMDKAWLAL